MSLAGVQVNDGDHVRGVSLFSNCGAGDIGFRQAGFRFQVMAELDRRRLEVAALNHPEAMVVWGDLRETWPQVVTAWQTIAGEYASPDLLAACPPCQGLSTARGNRGLAEDADAGSRDSRNLLVEVIASVARELKPRAIIVENVPEFLTRAVRHPETLDPVSAAKLLISRLSEHYEVFPLLTDLADYGVPQVRERSFLTFIHREEPALDVLRADGVTPYPVPDRAPDHGGPGHIPLRDALESLGLPSLDAADPGKATDPERPLHFVPVWTDRRYPMVAAIPASSGASAWENDRCPECGPISAGRYDAVCLDCGTALLRPVVKEGDAWRLVKGFRSSSYRRMDPSRPTSTITTASGHIGSDRTIHPWENRLLSPLECALLQTIPNDFNWGRALDRWGATNVREMIGEAVPPLFTRLHGRVLEALLAGAELPSLLRSDDPRCTKARSRLHRGPRSRRPVGQP